MTGQYPAFQVLRARFTGQTALVLVGLLATRRLHAALRTRKPGLQAARSVLQFGTGLLLFLSLSRMGLVEASAAADVGPVLITPGAARFLGERIGPRRLFGVLAALAGAMITTRPGRDVSSPRALLPLAAAVGEVPDRWAIVGALVIAGAGLYVWHRETRTMRQGG